MQVRGGAAGVRLEQIVYKGWALERADPGPGVTISSVRHPVEREEGEAGEALWAFYSGNTTADPDE